MVEASETFGVFHNVFGIVADTLQISHGAEGGGEVDVVFLA